jgi:FAD binding domain-containing protein
MQQIAVPSTSARPAASREALLEGIAFQQNQPWVNWGQTARCLPDYTFHPRTVEDLIEIVHFARESGRKIRAVATGHSWSALVPTDGILVSVQLPEKSPVG